jgi:hypothetical protein
MEQNTKDFIKRLKEEERSDKEIYLQMGICFSLFVCILPPFNLLSVLSITIMMGIALFLYFSISSHEKMLNSLEEEEFDGSELGI